MSRLATSFILGYHGCDDQIADKILAGETRLTQSDKSYDWLGPGAYFWEADPIRAYEFAKWKNSRGKISKAAVIGAVIDLRNCFDTSNRMDIQLLSNMHENLKNIHESAGWDLPKNKNSKGDQFDDLLLRHLDCAVFKHLHVKMEESKDANYDTVRGLFLEGDAVFPGSGIKAKSHVQIAVRNLSCIKGFFRPLVDGKVMQYDSL